MLNNGVRLLQHTHISREASFCAGSLWTWEQAFPYARQLRYGLPSRTSRAKTCMGAVLVELNRSDSTMNKSYSAIPLTPLMREGSSPRGLPYKGYYQLPFRQRYPQPPVRKIQSQDLTENTTLTEHHQTKSNIELVSSKIYIYNEVRNLRTRASVAIAAEHTTQQDLADPRSRP